MPSSEETITPAQALSFCLLCIVLPLVASSCLAGAAGGYGARLSGSSPRTAMMVGVAVCLCSCVLCFGPWNLRTGSDPAAK